MKVAFHTLGCKVNSYESQAMLNMFEESGYEEVDFKEVADVYVVNTCTVTNTGDSKSRQMIRKAIRKNPQATVCVVGCYSQVAPQDIEAIEGVSIILGTQFRNEIVDLVEKYQQTHERIVKVSEVKQLRKFEDLNIDRFLHTRAYLKIQDGCNNFCTYCIVPYVRGREKSREPKEIIREIERLVSDGVKEVMLLGQNVNSYGKTLEDDITFAKLLREIAKIDGLERIRFMTPHPKDLSDELIEAIRDNSKICNHIHLPLQSGSSRLLKLMNRQYTKEHYLELVDKIRNTIPDISITTDIIVGFPGETEEDFEDTLDVVRKAKYDSAYTFIYSKRTGTPAAKMDGQVSEDIVKDRFNRLLATVSEVSHEHIKRYEGMDMDVLVEDIDDHDNTFVTGRMTNNILVHFKGDKELIGSIVNVHLDECKGFYYMGTKND